MSFIEGLLRRLPPYLREKAQETDFNQFYALPRHLQKGLLSEDAAQYQQAIADIEAMERMRGQQLFGPAAAELARDLRAYREQRLGAKKNTS